MQQEEILKISQLLLSGQASSIALAYELIKANKDSVEPLQRELVLTLMFHDDKVLTKKLDGFLRRRYSESGIYEDWKNQFAIFAYIPKINNPKDILLNKYITAHENIRPLYQVLIEQSPKYSHYYYLLTNALHYTVKDKFELAKEYYNIALKAQPDDWNTLFCIAHLYQDYLFDEQMSLDYYQKAAQINPNNAAIYNNIAVLKSNSKNYEAAVEYYEKALNLAPSKILYICNLASACLSAGYTERFEQLIQDIFAIDRYYYRGINLWANYLWEHKAAYQEAEEEYLRGLQYYPQNSNLLGNLGELYADIFGRHEEAFDLYQKALRANPNSLYRHCTVFSFIVLKMNKIKDAIPVYQRCLELQKQEKKQRDVDLSEQQWEDFLKAQEILLSKASQDDLELV